MIGRNGSKFASHHGTHTPSRSELTYHKMDAVIHVAPTSPSSITTYREPIVCLDDNALDSKPMARPVTPVEPTPKVDEVRNSLEFRRSRTRAVTLDEAWWLKLDAASAL